MDNALIKATSWGTQLVFIFKRKKEKGKNKSNRSTPVFGNVEVQVHRFGSACLNRLLTYLRISLNGIKKCTISHSCHYACVACMGLENMHKQDSEGAEVFRPFSQKIGHGFASCASAAFLCNVEAKKKRFLIG